MVAGYSFTRSKMTNWGWADEVEGHSHSYCGPALAILYLSQVNVYYSHSSILGYISWVEQWLTNSEKEVIAIHTVAKLKPPHILVV